MTRLARAMLSASALLAVSGAAQAQSTVVGEDVANRVHPEYTPKAFPIGSFDMYPTVTAGVNATDNLRATSTNKVKSAFFTIRPEVNARSTWARHSLNWRVYVDQVLHPKLTSENVTTFGGSLNGLYDLSRQTQFQLNLSAARAAESRL
ncbi:MAG TPA: outer membrane beta-barrel protein, partial [Novosphingobium sp.]